MVIWTCVQVAGTVAGADAGTSTSKHRFWPCLLTSAREAVQADTDDDDDEETDSYGY